MVGRRSRAADARVVAAVVGVAVAFVVVVVVCGLLFVGGPGGGLVGWYVR